MNNISHNAKSTDNPTKKIKETADLSDESLLRGFVDKPIYDKLIYDKHIYDFLLRRKKCVSRFIYYLKYITAFSPIPRRLTVSTCGSVLEPSASNLNLFLQPFVPTIGNTSALNNKLILIHCIWFLLSFHGA